ncbi:aquaporin [Kitasatospora sp. NPDC049285]|uniref:aquaporin n=1 Tax=Kitasatospora sp. NPDC049285 TaxID=3157096 RepID=UPI00343360FE
MSTNSLAGRLTAEAVGTAVLAATAVGAGLKAVSGPAGGVGAVAGTLAPAAALAVLIALFAPVSGGHLNPLVTAAAWWPARREPGAGRTAAGYAAAQLLGAAGGVALAAAMFGRLPAVSAVHRDGPRQWLGEAVATGVLILLVAALVRGGRVALAPLAVGGWVVAAGWAVPSGGFANPALTLARAVAADPAGIAPHSLPGFLIAQLVGAAAGLALATALFQAAPGV